MPKIERSVDYTFEAYSGVEDQENEIDGVQEKSLEGNNNSNFMCLNDVSDDENSE